MSHPAVKRNAAAQDDFLLNMKIFFVLVGIATLLILVFS